ncbi:small polypeptide DEVIL 13 [Pyrus x bretschneideri]|uniref:small polypeptide DEVIL 13 n=2 Tax=Pyrus TaxID=3766 RepID=UPI00202FCE8B|nr:small polypeptide DEVIL 13 [Pyrus x bretschneideri]
MSAPSIYSFSATPILFCYPPPTSAVTNSPMATSYFQQPQTHQARRRKSHRKIGFRKRCLMMAKQQKTRFYILGRCVSMLLCWHDHSISD